MSHPAFQLQQPAPDQLKLSGALNFQTAAQVLVQAGAKISAGKVRTLDLSDVRSADSAGLACLLALRARAAGSGGMLTIRGMPESLARLAAVSDAGPLLGTP